MKTISKGTSILSILYHILKPQSPIIGTFDWSLNFIYRETKRKERYNIDILKIKFKNGSRSGVHEMFYLVKLLILHTSFS